MEVKGKLTKENIAHTMPVDAPVFHKKPFYFKGAKMYSFNYETDPSVVAELVPEQLTLANPATAVLMFCEYPWSTIGYYKEAILAVDVTYNGEAFKYMTHLILDSLEPVLVGREVFGIPKVMGEIEFSAEGGVLGAYVERPKGIRIASGVFRAEAPVESLPNETLMRTLTLRVVPSPEEGEVHSSIELIETNSILNPVELWSGTGSCHFPGISVFDPWHKVPVKNNIGAHYMVTDIVLTGSKVVDRF